MSIKRQGGLWFWRIGPFGGSVYRAGPSAEKRKADRARQRRAWRALRAAVKECRA